MALTGEHLTEGVCDVHGFDVLCAGGGGLECAVHDLVRQIGEVAPLTVEVAREIALIPAEHPDIRPRHSRTVLQLTE